MFVPFNTQPTVYWNRSWKFYLHAKPHCGDPQQRDHNTISEHGRIDNFLLKMRADFVYKTNISNCSFASWNITTVFNFDFWKCIPSVRQVWHLRLLPVWARNFDPSEPKLCRKLDYLTVISSWLWSEMFCKIFPWTNMSVKLLVRVHCRRRIAVSYLKGQLIILSLVSPSKKLL